ncbi:NAD-dependent protein deacylase [Oceaniferula spumae]|uniref:NAD-dependent protein deacylase n=1 Tax=Oceaniferula spumae TaxID=2979115 RepID=A0AAT9FHW8_9BACT
MKNIFILTGAGISAESGLKTFRDAGGLWEGHKVEDVATPGAFAVDPELVHHFYNMRREQLATVEPNAAHAALARLQEHFGEHLTLVTQNVDDLHERAGCRDVIHMHGELLKKRCASCEVVSPCTGSLTYDCVCANCGSEGRMRPHIVWFGEIPFFMDEIQEKLIEADVFIAIGTSGVVYPAAGFAEVAKHHGAKTIEVNLDGTEQSPLFDEHIIGKASETVPMLVERLR